MRGSSQSGRWNPLQVPCGTTFAPSTRFGKPSGTVPNQPGSTGVMLNSRTRSAILRPRSARRSSRRRLTGPPNPDMFCNSHHGWCAGAGIHASNSASEYPNRRNVSK